MFAAGFRPGALGALALLAGVLLLAAPDAHARRNSKFTVGLGLATNTVSGDFDGTSVYTSNPVTGPNVYSAKLEKGSGPVVLGGVHINDSIGVDGLIVVTSHDAKSQAAVLANQPLKATVTSLIVAMRLMAPLGENFELFGRLGLGVLGVGIDKNTQLPPSTVFQSSTFSGSALVAGVGAALFFGEVGLEFGLLSQNGKLTSLSAAGQSGAIPDTSFKLNTVTIALTGHWGN